MLGFVLFVLEIFLLFLGFVPFLELLEFVPFVPNKTYFVLLMLIFRPEISWNSLKMFNSFFYLKFNVFHFEIDVEVISIAITYMFVANCSCLQPSTVRSQCIG